MIHVEEKGRRLEVTVGGEETFLVDPVNFQTGAALLSHFLGVATIGVVAETDDTVDSEAVSTLAEDESSKMAVLAMGEANWERAQSLRAEEVTQLTLAAFYWNAQGGGMKALQAFLDGDEGKATGIVFRAAGVSMKPRSMTLPDGDGAAETL